MATDLTRIGEKARQEPTLVFTTLYHHITDVDNLRACYDSLPAHKASGVDGVTKTDYGKHLEENLRDLSARLKRQGYRPAPKRRTYVPKAGSAKGRPLGTAILKTRLLRQRPNARWSPSTRPYSRTVATDTDRDAARTSAWMPSAGLSNRSASPTSSRPTSARILRRSITRGRSSFYDIALGTSGSSVWSSGC